MATLEQDLLTIAEALGQTQANIDFYRARLHAIAESIRDRTWTPRTLRRCSVRIEYGAIDDAARDPETGDVAWSVRSDGLIEHLLELVLACPVGTTSDIERPLVSAEDIPF